MPSRRYDLPSGLMELRAFAVAMRDELYAQNLYIEKLKARVAVPVQQRGLRKTREGRL